MGSTVTLRPGLCTPSAEAAAPPIERPCTWLGLGLEVRVRVRVRVRVKVRVKVRVRG